MRGRNDAASAPVGTDRRFEHLRELDDFNAGVHGAATQQDDRPFGVTKDLRGRLDGLVVDRVGRQGHRPVGEHDLAALGPGVERAFQGDGTRAARGGVPDRLADQRRRLLRAADALGPLGDVAHEAQLVVDLMQMAVALVDVGLRDLADQADHGRVHAVGREERRAGIEQAGPGHHAERLRLAGRERRAQRHVGGRLLVTRMDHAQPVRSMIEGVEQRILMQAGQGIHRVDAMEQEGFDRGFGGAEAGHVGSLSAAGNAIKAMTCG